MPKFNAVSPIGQSVDSTEIEDNSIVNADINTSAAIVESKLQFHDSTGHTHTGTGNDGTKLSFTGFDADAILGDGNPSFMLNWGLESDFDDEVTTTLTGSGSVSRSTHDQIVNAATGATNPSTAQITVQAGAEPHPSRTSGWTKIVMETSLKLTPTAANAFNFWWGTDNAGGGTNRIEIIHIGASHAADTFILRTYDNGGTNEDSATWTVTDYTAYTVYKIEVVMDGAGAITSVKAYADGVLKATNSTNVPSVSDNVDWGYYYISGAGANQQYHIKYYKYWTEE